MSERSYLHTAEKHVSHVDKSYTGQMRFLLAGKRDTCLQQKVLIRSFNYRGWVIDSHEEWENVPIVTEEETRT